MLKTCILYLKVFKMCVRDLYFSIITLYRCEEEEEEEVGGGEEEEEEEDKKKEKKEKEE
jgi:hypothetical protein